MGNDGAVRWSRRLASEERSGKREGKRETAAEAWPPAMLWWSALRRPEVGGDSRPGTDIGWEWEARWGRAHDGRARLGSHVFAANAGRPIQKMDGRDGPAGRLKS